MVVDTSAVVAFLQDEPEAGRIEEILDRAPDLHMSAFNAFECRTVLHVRYGARGAADFELFLARAGIVVEPFDDEQVEYAFAAYRRFGKGTGHPARLNLGDCAAYALAHSLGLPLLYKGDDFARTDIARVL
jgi:ribonuclease VapC